VAFRDAVPGILMQLDVVNSLIDEDSRGHRTPDFSSWWSGQHPLRVALHELRNAEVKRQERRTGRSVSLQWILVRRVITDSRYENLPTGIMSPFFPRLDWFFIEGGFAGQKVLDTLRDYASHLRDK